jgi:hypothetical protein
MPRHGRFDSMLPATSGCYFAGFQYTADSSRAHAGSRTSPRGPIADIHGFTSSTGVPSYRVQVFHRDR